MFLGKSQFLQLILSIIDLIKNIIGMTMWLSGIIEKPGTVKINHIQRGFPVKEVFNKFKKG